MKKAASLLLLGIVAVGHAQTTLNPVWTRPSLDMPKGLAAQPNAGSLLLVVDGSQLLMMDRTTNKMKWHRRAWTRSAAFTPDGASIVVCEGSSFEEQKIDLLDANTGALKRTIVGPDFSNPFVLSPDGSKLIVSYTGVFRFSDGARLATSSPVFDEGEYSPNGGWIRLDSYVVKASDFTYIDGIGTGRGGAFATDSASFVHVNYDSTVSVYSIPGGTKLRDIALPTAFQARSIAPLGTTGKFVVGGMEEVNGNDVFAWSVVDAAGIVYETKVTASKVTDYSYTFPIRGKGNDGFWYAFNAAYGEGSDPLVEVPVTNGHSGTSTVKIDTTSTADYLGASTGPQVAVGSAWHAQLDLLNATDGTLLKRNADEIPFYSDLFMGPSGRYLYYFQNATDSPFKAMSIPGGGIANAALAGTVNYTVPMADDTVMMRLNDSICRLTRSNGGFTIFRDYGIKANPVAATADAKQWLAADEAGLYLLDVAHGAVLARTTWPWGVGADIPATPDMQVAAPSADDITLARVSFNYDKSQYELEIRRFAQAGAALVARGPGLKRIYPQVKTVNGEDFYMEVKYRLAPDGHSLWINYQEEDGDALAGNQWRGEYVRTSDGALLGSYVDPTFDLKCDSVEVSPANGKVFLGRLFGTVQAVAIPQGLAGAAAAPFELAGGEPRNVQLDLAAPAANARTVTLQGDAVAGVPNSVTIPAGARTFNVPVTTTPTTTVQTATVKVTDNGTTAQVFLRVNPPRMAAATFPAATAKGGTTAVLTITLDGAAPAGGAVVTMTDNSSVATTPASVTIPAGARQATVNIPLSRVTQNVVLRFTLHREGRSLVVPLTATP